MTSSDNSDLSEQEFKDNQSTDDSIAAAPKDFTEVSPEAVAVRVKLDAALDFLKSLKGQPVEVSLSSLTVSCDALRAGDVEELVARVRNLAESEIGRLYLEPARHREGWALRDDEVAGQLGWNEESDHGKPYRVIIDGRTLSWEELGRALESYEGWRFRLVIEDSIDDARTDADIVQLRGRGSRPEPTSG